MLINRRYIPIFFDTEFTGFQQNTKLISIGLIVGKDEVLKQDAYFYAEDVSIDFDTVETTEENRSFLKQNVKPNLMSEDHKEYIESDENLHRVICLSNYEKIQNKLREWLDELVVEYRKVYKYDHVKFIPVSDVMQYDMILLTELSKYHYSIYPAGYDINQLIARYMQHRRKEIDPDDEIVNNPMHFISEAFDVSREDLVRYIANQNNYENPFDIIGIQKHNAMFDAKIIKILFEFLKEYM